MVNTMSIAIMLAKAAHKDDAVDPEMEAAMARRDAKLDACRRVIIAVKHGEAADLCAALEDFDEICDAEEGE